MWFLCHRSGWNQCEVNHLCFPPSHHLLVVDGIIWLTASLANQRLSWYLCGVGVQSRSSGAGLAWMGRERSGGSSSRSDSSGSDPGSDPPLWATLRKRSCDYDDYNGEEWKPPQLTLKSPSAEIRTGRKHAKPFGSQLQILAFCGCPAVNLGNLWHLGRTERRGGPGNYTDVG